MHGKSFEYLRANAVVLLGSVLAIPIRLIHEPTSLAVVLLRQAVLLRADRQFSSARVLVLTRSGVFV